MSRIENIITTTFRANGGNLLSTIGQAGAGVTRFGQIINENSRMSERINSQWRAIATTIRYAIAGTAVFGLGRMVGQLREINSQLGQMQALSGIGGTAFTNRQVDALGNRLQTTAIQAITPLQDVNEAAINFLSTVGDVQSSELPTMLQQIGIGAKLAQTPIEDLTQAATTFQIAFGRAVNPGTIGQFTRMWAQLINVAPGGIAAAPTIAQSIPGLASMFQLAPGRGVAPNVAQAQLMSLTLGVLRTGMPAATAMRGLTYLLQSVAQPTGGARKALAGIGITPQTVERQGVYANTMKLLQTITARPGVAKRLGAMDDNSLDVLEQSGGNLPGISANEMTRLRAMIPRIHGIRAAIILASQMQQKGNVQSLQGDLGMMLGAQNTNSDETRAISKAWQDLSRRSRLQQATVAVQTMGVQIAQAFNPVFDFVASGIALHIAPAMQHHRRAIQNIARGGAIFAGALTLGRFAFGGNLLSRIPGLRGLTGGRALIAENALRAAAANPLTLGASPQNPLYVVVVGEIFGGAVVGGGGMGGGPGGNAPVPLSRFRRFGTKVAPYAASAAISGVTAAGIATAATGAGAAVLIGNMAGEHASYDYRLRHAAQRVDPKRFPNLARLIALTGRQDLSSLPPNERNLLMHLERGQITPGQAARILRGRADVNVQIQQVDANGKVIQQKRVHVPVEMWSGGAFPRHGGNPGSQRGNRSR